MNPFFKDAESYSRLLNPVEQYVDQAAFFLSKMHGITVEEAKSFVKRAIQKGGIAEAERPIVVYTERQENGDRIVKESTITDYIYSAINKGYIIAPTLTCYLPEHVLESIPSLFIKANIDKRSSVKKEMFVVTEEAEQLQRDFDAMLANSESSNG